MSEKVLSSLVAVLSQSLISRVISPLGQAAAPAVKPLLTTEPTKTLALADSFNVEARVEPPQVTTPPPTVALNV